MAFSNSSLVSLTKLSPNKTSPRNNDKIDMIVIHCYAARVSIETALNNFAKSSSAHSSHYTIGEDGRIGQSVLEKDRSWTTGGKDKNGKVIYNHGYSGAMIDHRAVTIECSSGSKAPYEINDKVYKSLIKLLADICKRNNIKKLLWENDEALIGQVDKQNLALHRWFANKECPGGYIMSKLPTIVSETNAMLAPSVDSIQTVYGKTYKYVNSDNYIINVFDFKTEWDAWFAAGSAYNSWPKKVYTAKAFSVFEHSDLTLNLGLFNMKAPKKNAPCNYVRTQALQEVGYGGTESRGIILELSWANKCAGYAVGIMNGVVQKNSKINPYLGGTSCRNGIGITEDGRLITAQSMKKITETTFVNKVNSFVPAMYGTKVKLFLFEDGGGSTQEYSSISKLNFIPQGQRAVATVTCLKRKNVPKITRTLSKDCRGWDVMLLQTCLGGICCDGWYGNGTITRVKAAQKALGLAQTGIADEKLLTKMGLM